MTSASLHTVCCYKGSLYLVLVLPSSASAAEPSPSHSSQSLVSRKGNKRLRLLTNWRQLNAITRVAKRINEGLSEVRVLMTL